MSTTTLLSNGWSPLLTVTLQLLFFQLKNDFVRSSTRLTSASLALCQEIKLSLFSGIPWAFFDPCQIELPLFPYHSQQHCLLVHGFEIFVKIFIHIYSIEYFFSKIYLVRNISYNRILLIHFQISKNEIEHYTTV